MKRLLVAALLAASVPAVAQPVHVALEGGIFFANMKQKAWSSPYGNYSIDGDLKPGLRAGLAIDARLTRSVWFQTGAFYVRKGAEDFGPIDKVRLNYIEVPLYLVKKIGTPATGNFFIGGGPFIAGALDGSIKDRRTSYDVRLGSGINDDFRRFDAGLGLTTGYEFPGRVYLRGNANFGLANILPGGSSDNRIRNWGLGVSVGYRLM